MWSYGDSSDGLAVATPTEGEGAIGFARGLATVTGDVTRGAAVTRRRRRAKSTYTLTYQHSFTHFQHLLHFYTHPPLLTLIHSLTLHRPHHPPPTTHAHTCRGHIIPIPWITPLHSISIFTSHHHSPTHTQASCRRTLCALTPVSVDFTERLRLLPPPSGEVVMPRSCQPGSCRKACIYGVG